MNNILALTFFLYAFSNQSLADENINENLEDRFLNTKSEKELKVLSFHSAVIENKTIYTLQAPSEFIKSDNLGYIHRPSSNVKHILRTLDTTIFNANYSFDQYSRRYNPNQRYTTKNKFLILHGCSFTYGYGLNDDQTLSHYLNLYSKNHHTYNYAIGASGPHMMLAQLQERKLKVQIEQAKGSFVYVYINEHIQRSNGFMSELSWVDTTPFFEIINERPKRNGNFLSATPLRTSFFNFLRNVIKLDQITGQNFPSIMNSHINYTCQIIKESKREFVSQYKSSQFYTMIHPLSQMDHRLKKCLIDSGVRVLDISNVLPKIPNISTYKIPYDGHPSKKINSIIAKILQKDLSL